MVRKSISTQPLRCSYLSYSGPYHIDINTATLLNQKIIKKCLRSPSRIHGFPSEYDASRKTFHKEAVQAVSHLCHTSLTYLLHSGPEAQIPPTCNAYSQQRTFLFEFEFVHINMHYSGTVLELSMVVPEYELAAVIVMHA